MRGLDPAIHVVMSRDPMTWMPATSAGMTGLARRLKRPLTRLTLIKAGAMM